MLENMSVLIYTCVGTYHTNTHKVLAWQLVTSVQTEDMQGFQTLWQSNAGTHVDPKSTKDNGSLYAVSRH